MHRLIFKTVPLLLLTLLMLASLGLVAQTASPAKPAGNAASGSQPATPADMKKDAEPESPAAEPAQPMTPEELPAEAPVVSYTGGQLKIDSKNATLGEILDAIQKKTGAQFETLPSVGSERVAAHLSGSPRQVISDLLYGSKFGYVIMTAPDDPAAVQRVVLTDPPADKQSPAVATPLNRQVPGRQRPPVATRAAESSPDAEETAATEPEPTPGQRPPVEPEVQLQPTGTPAAAATLDPPAESTNANGQLPPNQPMQLPPSQQSSDLGQQQSAKTPGEFMQGLYRQRLQIQQQQQQKQNPPPPPQ